jgi:CHAT domain-containing protein
MVIPMRNTMHLLPLILLASILLNRAALAQSFAVEDTIALDSLRGSLIPLNWAEKEVTSISDLMNGEAYCYRRASEKMFKERAPKAGILHIATHAVVNDVNPLFSKLIFSPEPASGEDGFLNTYELYNMKLNAQLVVLSACNTGYGTLVRGEGIMSLARGFMYAGCPAIIMSLWPVDDQSTSLLMQKFYEGLKKGQNKDEALRNAKLDFLKNADEVKANPFYWSGMIFVGDMNPLPTDQKGK